MKMKVSRLLAVTLFTPKRMVLSSLPCRQTWLIQISNCPTNKKSDHAFFVRLEKVNERQERGVRTDPPYLRGVEPSSQHVGYTAIVHSCRVRT